MKLGLVASSNGLGHARRLLHLVEAFLRLNINTSLFISQRQVDLLDREIRELKLTDLKIVFIDCYGLDGIDLENAKSLSQVPIEVGHQISDCNFIISDNCLWPALFTNNLYLLGHFDWITYWSRTQPKSPHLREKLHELTTQELPLQSGVVKWFQTRDFVLDDLLNIQRVPIPLLRYQSDQEQGDIRGDDVWFAMGTTVNHLDAGVLGPRFGQRRETWLIFSSLAKPKLVIGRAGLGTIRDCLASTTPFLPIASNNDPELSHNVAVLERLGLIPQHGIQSLETIELQELKKLTSSMFDYWERASMSTLEVAAHILEVID